MRTLECQCFKMAEEDVFLAATSNALWDPHHSKDWDKENVTPQCVLRIKRYDRVIVILSRYAARFSSGLRTYCY